MNVNKNLRAALMEALLEIVEQAAAAGIDSSCPDLIVQFPDPDGTTIYKIELLEDDEGVFHSQGLEIGDA